MVSWQNSFGYDYETLISKKNRVRKLIDFVISLVYK